MRHNCLRPLNRDIRICIEKKWVAGMLVKETNGSNYAWYKQPPLHCTTLPVADTDKPIYNRVHNASSRAWTVPLLPQAPDNTCTNTNDLSISSIYISFSSNFRVLNFRGNAVVWTKVRWSPLILRNLEHCWKNHIFVRVFVYEHENSWIAILSPWISTNNCLIPPQELN